MKDLLDLVLLEFLHARSGDMSSTKPAVTTIATTFACGDASRRGADRLLPHQLLQANHFAVGHASRIWPR